MTYIPTALSKREDEVLRRWDALATLGTIIGENEKRDAIHLAVDPVIAGEELRAGQHVGVVKGKAYSVNSWGIKGLGIVDPFLRTRVQVGERFWLVVYPRQITSLRHVWSHPDFAETQDVKIVTIDAIAARVARGWMDAYAESLGIDGGTLIQAAKDYLEQGDYLSDGGKFEGINVPDDFWNHYEVIAGELVSPDRRGSFFSCSC